MYAVLIEKGRITREAVLKGCPVVVRKLYTEPRIAICIRTSKKNGVRETIHSTTMNTNHEFPASIASLIDISTKKLKELTKTFGTIKNNK
jgi:hypothetical protein